MSFFNKNYPMKPFILTFVIACIAFSAASGAIPQKINFQGKLTDDSGVPIDGSRNFIFTIHDDPTADNTLWTETQNGVTVSEGVFSVQLGTNTPITLDTFDGMNCWLEIEVGGETLSPRQQLIAGAYSFVAQKAQGLLDNATGYTVNLSTLSVRGPNLYLKGGVYDGFSSNFTINRIDVDEPTHALGLKLRITGALGQYYDVLHFQGINAYFYSNYSSATLNMGTNDITDIGDLDANTITAGTILYPPSGTSLPTGTSAGGIYYDSDNFTLYLATETTSGDQSWVVLGAAGQ